jgi:NTE family protein
VARTLALALGGGGAPGLGHIAVLEALDEMGVRPVAISGTSIGALIGTCYAAGMTGREIRALAQDLADHPMRIARAVAGSVAFNGWGTLPALNAMRVMTTVLADAIPERFEDLQIPLTIVATDYHMRAEAHFTAGPLRPALAASIAIPGVFTPVVIDDVVYTDGGVTNNLPYDVLPPADAVLAVDVATEILSPSTAVPGPLEVATGAIRGMMQAMLETKLEITQPDILIRPRTRRFGPLDFDKCAAILALPDDAAQRTREALGKAGFSPAPEPLPRPGA